MYDSGTPESRASSPPDFAGTGISESEEITEERKEDGKQGLENRDGPKVLPFEFVALEACLESACSCLENEVMYPTFCEDRFTFTFLASLLCCFIVYTSTHFWFLI